MSAIITVPLLFPVVISNFGNPITAVAADSPTGTCAYRKVTILVTAGVLKVGFRNPLNASINWLSYAASVYPVELCPPDRASVDLSKVLLDGVDNTARANLIAWPCRI